MSAERLTPAPPLSSVRDPLGYRRCGAQHLYCVELTGEHTVGREAVDDGVAGRTHVRDRARTSPRAPRAQGQKIFVPGKKATVIFRSSTRTTPGFAIDFAVDKCTADEPCLRGTAGAAGKRAADIVPSGGGGASE